MRVCRAKRPTMYRPCFMSSLAFVNKTLSGSAEVPATGAAFFFPRQPPSSDAVKIKTQIARPCFNNFASRLLCQRPSGHLLHGPDRFGSIGGMKNGRAGNQNFGASPDQFHYVVRTDSPVDLDPERQIIALSN